LNDPKHRRSFRDDWDPKAVIALVVIVGAFVLAAISLTLDKPDATIPAWVAALVGGIGIYYYRNGKDR
jgi:Na+/glutamate symporter